MRTTRFEAEGPMCPSLHSVLGPALETAEALPNRPVAEIEVSGERYPIFPLQGAPLPSREVEGRIDAMCCYAGQSVGSVRRVQPAGEIVAELAGGAETLLTAMATHIVR